MYNIEQISNTMVDDCLAVVCYVDCGQMPKQKAKDYMEEVCGKLNDIFSEKDVKILVLPSKCKLEVLSKKEQEVLQEA